MTELLLRGRILTFHDEPLAGEASGEAFTYIEDGGLLIRDGKVVAVDEYAQVRAGDGIDAEVADHRPHLIMPGFIDTHIHYPQMQVVGSYAGALMEWLNKYTFVEEQKFSNQGHPEHIATSLLDELIRHGTTTAAAYCSVHKASVQAFFTEAHRRNMRMIAGKVMMDRNAPPGLLDTPQSGYDDSKALIGDWHGKGRQLYAITPRFAPTSSPEQLEMSGTLVREHPELHVQTHLCENTAEIAFVAELFPWSRDYTQVYEHYGLLGPKTLLGHCIHLTDAEIGSIANSGSVAVFCPTSNLFIGSGLFDLARLRASDPPVRTAIATDIGGGTSYSMLRTLDEGYKILNIQGQRYHPLRSFYQVTLGNARALSLEGTIGSFTPGAEADCVVLNARATPAMRIRMDTVETLVEELFLMQTMGDDRTIAEVYVAGKAAKSILRS
ncbi:guanine deaminase [Phyllobacterium brassicacearum]|uniref:Guanine deaminase n=1 Tax=Phyllobacterium brassicacearum TaxID=314235 RepID=A0A2P7BTP8_9HYPH|nr:guanine deaminase [Phyllobacterium brassicacearum]PSH69849.1 guanine deaminase [Phyllobacterium brassicacearum]TDQ35017.1 guanine deaminase [Phyllobacterium brassicacearum]